MKQDGGAHKGGSAASWRAAEAAATAANLGASSARATGDEESPIEAGTEDSLVAVRAAARKVEGSAWALFARHFRALFVKRWHNTKRDSKAFCYQVRKEAQGVLSACLTVSTLGTTFVCQHIA